jgi:hypothetical protein
MKPSVESTLSPRPLGQDCVFHLSGIIQCRNVEIVLVRYNEVAHKLKCSGPLRRGEPVGQEEGRELFWISLPNCRPDLETLRRLAGPGGGPGSVGGASGSDDGGGVGVKPVIDGVVQLTDKGLREGFRRLNGRRVRGKIVLTTN